MPATVENGPRGERGMSIQPSLSQPCTRAHMGSTDSAGGHRHRHGERRRTSGWWAACGSATAMVSTTMPPTSRMTMGSSAGQSTLGVGMRAVVVAASSEQRRS